LVPEPDASTATVMIRAISIFCLSNPV